MGGARSQNYFSQALDQRDHKKSNTTRGNESETLIRFSFSANGGATICIFCSFRSDLHHRSYLSIIEIIEYFIGSSHFVDRAGASNFSLHLQLFLLSSSPSVDFYRAVVKYKILAIERDFLLLVSFSALWSM